MFGRARPHPGEITLALFNDLPPEALELARFWVTPKRSFVAVGRSNTWAPELLGSLLVECVHTAAASYASSTDISEAEAIERIWRGFDEERTRLGSDHSPEDLH